MSPVRIPTVGRERPVKERGRLANAVGGLPVPARRVDRRSGRCGVPRPARSGPRRAEDGREGEGGGAGALRRAPAALSAKAAGTVEAEDGGGTGARSGTARAVPERAHHAAVLVRLRRIGSNDALPLGSGVFCRVLRNRRELAGLAGLAPVPWASGGGGHDQGNGRADSPMLRRHLVRMAWRWLYHQPDSALLKWFREYAVARATAVRAGGGSWRWYAGC